MAAVRLLFVVCARGGLWSAPGLDPIDPDYAKLNLDSWTAWRLVGGNNREIARSARTFSTFHDCYQAARDVQQRLPDAVSTMRHDDTKNRWGWRLEIDDVNIVTSGRLYQRFRECQANLRQFLDLMPLAATAYDSVVLATDAADGDPAEIVPTQLSSAEHDVPLLRHFG